MVPSDSARVHLQVVTGLGGGLNIFFAALLIVFRRAWSMLFTTDPAILARLDPVIIWLSIALVGEQLLASCGSAVGRRKYIVQHAHCS